MYRSRHRQPRWQIEASVSSFPLLLRNLNPKQGYRKRKLLKTYEFRAKVPAGGKQPVLAGSERVGERKVRGLFPLRRSFEAQPSGSSVEALPLAGRLLHTQPI